jgi:hypothetical protein
MGMGTDQLGETQGKGLELTEMLSVANIEIKSHLLVVCWTTLLETHRKGWGRIQLIDIARRKRNLLMKNTTSPMEDKALLVLMH